MKIGIIVYSRTGNTLSVAEKLKGELTAAGHSAILEKVKAVNEDPSAKSIQLKTIPDTSAYDVLIFGAPVQAFSLSAIMKAYLSQLSSLKGKKVCCFVTQHFPYSWMGGNHSIKQMRKICQDKEGKIFETGIVNWSHKERESRITQVIEKLSRL
jgi:flavodoxin